MLHPMTFREFLATLRPADTAIDAWAAQISAHMPDDNSVSRVAVEHYLAGRRTPIPRVFRAMLEVAGRDPDDVNAWAALGMAQSNRDRRDPDEAASS